MDTKFSINRIHVDAINFTGPRLEPRWNATVVFGVQSPYGDFELSVSVQNAETLDAAVCEASGTIKQWGSHFAEYLPHRTVPAA